MPSFLDSRQIFDCRDTEAGQNDVAPNSATDLKDSKRKSAISLFSGGGGLDIGIEQAGFRTLACIEKDANCCETLKANQPNFFSHAKIINGSVEDIDFPGLMKETGLKQGELDLLFGGPPCQTFSQIGKLGSLNDERGRLLFKMVEYAQVLQPKAILIENVKALLSAKDLAGSKGGVVRQLLSELQALGYSTTSEVINSADFGVPQNRKRLFIVAVKGEQAFTFPERTHLPDSYRTVGEALIGLPDPVAKGELAQINNHIDVTPAGDRHRISYVGEGMYLAKMMDAPSEVRGRLAPKDTTKFLRLGKKKQSNTLRCGEIFFHPVESRYLTPREYMRLHGYPDNYSLKGPIRGRSGSVKNLDQHRQVANSVPPPVAKAIGNQLIVHLHQLARAADG